MNAAPAFSVAVIARNESQHLPRLLKSLEPFISCGGEVVVLDGNSTDETAQIALDAGCRVVPQGDKSILMIDEGTSRRVNEQLILERDPPIFTGPDCLLDFSSARNYAASFCSNDMVMRVDADEFCVNFDFSAISDRVSAGAEYMLADYVFAYDTRGLPAIRFFINRLYDRRRFTWKNFAHECLEGIGKTEVLDTNLLLIGHQQNPQRDRGHALKALALDSVLHPDDARVAYYLAREFMNTRRFTSAIRQLWKRISMNGWNVERAHSLVLMGDCCGLCQKLDEQASWYFQAFQVDSTRREPLLRLAQLAKDQNNHSACAAFAGAALQIPWNGNFANDVSQYRQVPHDLLYWALWHMGQKEESRKHWEKCLEYEPWDSRFNFDGQFYLEYTGPGIDGWMTALELEWLYQTAKGTESIAEIGSWKGRSTHALCSGCKGTVTAIDHWEGSTRDGSRHEEAKFEAVYRQFLDNMKPFGDQLRAVKSSSEAAARSLNGERFDMVFIDGSHDYDSVVEDIRLWKPKAKRILCGHDFASEWPGVKQAVREELGEPDGVAGASIWWKRIVS